MHRFRSTSHTKRSAARPRRGLTSPAARLALTGTLLISLAACDVAARLHDGITAGEIGIMLRMGYDVECLLAALAVLVGGTLLLDYCVRRDGDKEKT